MSRPIQAITYDERAICIGGQRQLLLSGAIHYPRSTPEMWRPLLQHSRAAGLNTIETYLFWNLHEREHGVYDFAGRLDIRAFCDEVQAVGLHLILRLGPYICAETNYGGFPAWLREVPGMQMRTWNAPFQHEMERWVRFIVTYLRPYFADHGGPIILGHLENEYDNVKTQYGEAGQRYLQWAMSLGKTLGVDIPWLMCLAHPSSSSLVVDGALKTINAFYGHEYLANHFARHPDQPGLWTENWTGWYTAFGQPQHRRSAANQAYGVARFIAAGGTGVNYYLWHGGMNFGRESMYLGTPDYGFDAPLDVFGLPTAKFQRLAHLHAVLQAHAATLLAAPRSTPMSLGPDQYSYVYSARDHADLVFLCNDSREHTALVAFAGQSYALAPQSVRILDGTHVIFDSAAEDPTAPAPRRWQPLNLLFSPWQWWEEPIPARPAAIDARMVQAEQPIEQLRLTHDTTDYCWYTTTLIVDSAIVGNLTFHGGDWVSVFVDGQLIATLPAVLREDRGWFDSPDFRHTVSLTLSAGTHQVTFLCTALGLIKGDWMIGHHNMADERKGLWGPITWNGAALAGAWTMYPGLLGEVARIYGAGSAVVPWRQKAPDHTRPCTWWRTTFPRPDATTSLALDLQGMTKGMLWLNGQCVGRYWLVASRDEGEHWTLTAVTPEGVDTPSMRYYPLPSAWLREHNVLTLFEEIGGDPAQIGLCAWTSDVPSADTEWQAT